jgi:ABC-2 type transport system permease protein/sodium transport system permease protein
MPLLIYPLISIAFQKFLVTSLRPGTEVVFYLAVESKEEGEIISRYLSMGELLLSLQDSKRLSPEAGNEATPAEGTQDDPQEADLLPDTLGDIDDLPPLQLELRVVKNLTRSVTRINADLGVRVLHSEPLGGTDDSLQAIDCELVYVETSATARDALQFVERRLQAVNNYYLRRRLREMDVSDPLTPVNASRRTVKPPGGGPAFSLATLVPLILILMTITGAVYPAIDLTAGERERGTLETLVAAPVPRLGLLLAKYVAVVSVALLTATVNLVSMTVTILSIGLGSMLFGEAGLSGVVIIQVFGLLVLFAAFFSAVLLALTSFARSFKEAQAYLIPLMLVSITPGMLSMIPGLQLGGLLTVTPLVNIVLLARDLFEHTADPLHAVVVVLSTALFALVAIAVAARIFGTDAILYGSSGTWTELFQRPTEPCLAPSVTSALLCLTLMFPSHFVFVHLLARFAEHSIQLRLLLSSLMALLLFAGIPLAAAAVNRVRLKTGFRLHTAAPVAFLAALLLGVSLWPFAFEIVLVTERLGLAPLRAEQFVWANKLLEELRGLPPAAVLLSLAVIPAVAEELFFRGYLFSALCARTKAWRAVLASAVLFGLFHLVAKNALAIERLLPSMLLGAVLGWVCLKTNSLFPGIVLHACHNGSLLLIGHFRDDLADRGWGIETASHLPVSLLAVALIVAVAGFGLLILQSRQ